MVSLWAEWRVSRWVDEVAVPMAAKRAEHWDWKRAAKMVYALVEMMVGVLDVQRVAVLVDWTAEKSAEKSASMSVVRMVVRLGKTWDAISVVTKAAEKAGTMVAGKDNRLADQLVDAWADTLADVLADA